jgi:hypothetical protein
MLSMNMMTVITCRLGAICAPQRPHHHRLVLRFRCQATLITHILDSFRKASSPIPQDVSWTPCTSFPPSSIPLHIFPFQPTPDSNPRWRDCPHRSCGSRSSFRAWFAHIFLHEPHTHPIYWSTLPKAQTEHAYVSTSGSLLATCG